MLPFLKPKKQVGIIVAHRKPDGGPEITHEEGDELHALEAISEDLIRAMHSKDARAVAESLKAAFEMCETYPHEEGAHLEDKLEE